MDLNNVRRCVFDLSANLETAGQAFLKDLLAFVAAPTPAAPL
jgi:hypothetical protein